MNITRTISMTVLPEGEPLFSELATTITILDEGAGEYLAINQNEKGSGSIFVSPEEWPELRAAIDAMISKCANKDSK